MAFKRFVDYIPMIIDFQLLKGFDRTLDDALFKGMALGEDNIRQRCAAFLKEDPAVVRHREALQQDLERFEAALGDLQNIPAVGTGLGHDPEDEATTPPLELDGAVVTPPPIPANRKRYRAASPIPASPLREHEFFENVSDELGYMTERNSPPSSSGFGIPQAPVIYGSRRW